MTAQGTLLQQRPSRVLLSGAKAPRPQRIAQHTVSQALPSRPAQQGRPNTAVQASSVAEVPPAHTSSVSEKPLGDGPTIVNGQVCCRNAGSYSYASSSLLHRQVVGTLGFIRLTMCSC